MNDKRLPSAFRNQVQTLYALILVEGTNRFARRSLGLFEELAGILIHVIGFSFLRLATGAHSHYGMPVIAFLTSGVFLYWIFKTTIVPVSSFHAAKGRYAILPRITQLDVLMARAIVNGVLYVAIAMGTFVILYFCGLSDVMYHPFAVAFLMCVGGFWGFGAGLVLGAVFTYVPIIRTLLSGILRILMYTSGIFYIWPEVPYKLRIVAQYNPFFHLAELMRSAYFKSYQSAIADWHFVFYSVVITFALGLVLERNCRSQYGRLQKHISEEQDSYAIDAV